MKILDAIHALILHDQKILKPGRTLLKNVSGEIYKFIRVDTKLNWPRLIARDSKGIDCILNAQDLKNCEFQIIQHEITMEPVD